MSSLAPTPSSPLAPVTVGIVMGSSSDWEVMQHAVAILTEFHIPFEARVVSAHRMPLDMVEYGAQAPQRGMRAIIAGAGGAAHLPGMVAALTSVPVFGVPVPSKYLRGEDSLLSIVQMPKGVPVATFAIGEAGAANAALHVIANLATTDDDLRGRLDAFRARQTEVARAMALPITGLPEKVDASSSAGSATATSQAGSAAAAHTGGTSASSDLTGTTGSTVQSTQGGQP